MKNLYQDILKDNLGRLLNLVNLNPLSTKYGWVDREYSSWKTKDFSNGTLQGLAHALAISLRSNLLENEDKVKEIIKGILLATEDIQHSNGSYIEAYPNEHSWCVTALVAFDCLMTIRILPELFNEEEKTTFYRYIQKSIRFISSKNEEHAIISNHLATGYAAIVLWNDQMPDQYVDPSPILDRIIQHQSDEGWYLEYEGADPGYQTLCTYYLVAAWLVNKNEKLKKSIDESLSFLQHFAHPDGSIGGNYGSRNTEVYYPGGLVAYAPYNSLAAKVVDQLAIGFSNNVHVLPQHIDIGNFGPLLNSYAFAGLHSKQSETQKSENSPGGSSVNFAKAGILIKEVPNYKVYINYKKGGTIKLFDNKTKKLSFIDSGFIGKLSNGSYFTTQAFEDKQSFDHDTIVANFYSYSESYPGPFKFMVLRFFSLTIFRNIRLGNIFKRMIVKMLMTGKKQIKGKVIRRFVFNNDKISVNEEIHTPPNCQSISHGGKFTAIHMASSGYHTQHLFQVQSTSQLIEFK